MLCMLVSAGIVFIVTKMILLHVFKTKEENTWIKLCACVFSLILPALSLVIFVYLDWMMRISSLMKVVGALITPIFMPLNLWFFYIGYVLDPYSLWGFMRDERFLRTLLVIIQWIAIIGLSTYVTRKKGLISTLFVFMVSSSIMITIIYFFMQKLGYHFEMGSLP